MITMRLCKMFLNEIKFFFVMGADALHDIYTWKNVEELLKICSFAAVTRPGYKNAMLEKDAEILTNKYGGDIHLIEIPAIDISSSKIRERIKNGISVDDYVDKKVIDYIKENNLYR